METETSRTTYEREPVTLSFLLRNAPMAERGESKIVRLTCRHCDLLGPIHERNVQMVDCEFKPSEAESLAFIPADDPYVGAALVEDCVFESCTFWNVKVVTVPQSDVERETT